MGQQYMERWWQGLGRMKEEPQKHKCSMEEVPMCVNQRPTAGRRVEVAFWI